jgi:hypothetical protein
MIHVTTTKAEVPARNIQMTSRDAVNLGEDADQPPPRHNTDHRRNRHDKCQDPKAAQHAL